MKTIIILLALAAISAACSKQIERPQACGFVFDKYYESPPGDSSAAFRTYWLWLTNDTSSMPPPNIYYKLQVPKNIWDTMLVTGQSYPVYYCY